MLVRSTRHMLFGVFASFALVSFSIPAGYAQCGSLAATSTSAVAAGGDFNTAGTWDNGIPNSSTNTCIINGTAISPATVTLAASQTGNVLNLQVGANNTLTLSTGSNLEVFGTQVINDGSIGLNNTLELASSFTLSGAGILSMTGGQIGTNSNGYTLTNQSTIQGTGLIGSNSGAVHPNLNLNNGASGTIDANMTNQALTIGGDGGSITNAGLFEATGGGILSLTSSAAINNQGGTIEAMDPVFVASTVDVSTTIQGGTLTTTGGGVMQTVGTAGLDGITHGAITISDGSTYTAGAGTVTDIAGALILGTFTGGTLALNGTAELVLTGGLTVSGPGSVTMAGGQVGTNSNGYTLTNQTLIQGYGLLGSNAGADHPNLILANSGTIDADSSGNTLTIGGNGTSITNTGLFEATSGGTLVLSSSAAILNQGANITATGADSVVEVDGTTIEGGTLNTSGGGLMETVSTAGLDGASHGAITISDGSTYTAGSGTVTDVTGSLVLGTVSGGTLALNGTAELVLTGNTTLSGPGSVTMAGGQVGTNSTGYTLTNQAIIQGYGLLGSNAGSDHPNLTLANSGTIDANSTGNTLTIGGNGTSITNTGVFEATNGGTLVLSSTAAVLNQGANITATGTGSVVEVSTTIEGGTLNTSTGGVIETVGTAGLDGASHGAITISDGSTYTSGSATVTDITGSLILGTSTGGTWALSGTAVLTGGLTLSGPGSLTMAGGQVGTNSNGYTLTNQSLIQGYGLLGSNASSVYPNLSLANSGTIDANSSGNTLTIGGTGGSITNTGLFEATNGGTLVLSSTAPVLNQNADITATGAGSVVEVDNATIEGGTLNTSAGGVMETVGHSGLDGLSHGAITISDGSTYTAAGVAGDLTDITGSLILGTSTGGTLALGGQLRLTGNTTFSGPGTVTMTGDPTAAAGATGAQIGTNSNGYTLTNTTTITGSGLIGSNVGSLYQNLSLDNSGTINANSSENALEIGGTGGSITNTGLLEATNGGTLILSTQAAILNQNANITATGAGSVVEVDNTTIEGGTLNTSAGGTMEAVGDSGLDGLSHGAITISDGSTLTVGASATLTDIAGTLNLGTLTGGTLVLSSQLRLTGNTTLSGPGVLSISGPSNPSSASGGQIGTNSTGYTLTNQSTIQGTGLIGSNVGSLYQNLNVVNSGTISALGGTLQLGGTGTVTQTAMGTLVAQANSTLFVSAAFSGSDFSGGKLSNGAYEALGNGATLQIDSLGTLGGEIKQNAATIVLSGATAQITDALGLNALSDLQSNSGSFTAEGGQQFVTTSAGFSNSGAVNVEGSSSFTVPGAYTQTGGTTDVAAGGTLSALSFDLAGGTMQVDGTIDPPLITPPFTIAPGAELFGTGDTFANVVNSGEVFPGDDPTSGTLTITGNYEQTGTGVFMEDLEGTRGAPIVGLLDVFGNLQIDSGATLDLGALDFTPLFDQTFTVLDYTGTFNSGAFTLSGHDASDFTVLYNPGNIQLQYDVPNPSTPEPASFWLILALLASSLAWKNRRWVKL